MKTISVSYTEVAIIDDDDYWWACRVKWFLHHGYVLTKRMVRGSAVYLHREVMHCPAGMVVDHINGDKLDNRKANLRITTKKRNCQNRGMSSKNTSGFKGVTLQKPSNKWLAQINIDGRIQHLGSFNNPVSAAARYDEAALKLHGDFAKTNRMMRLIP